MFISFAWIWTRRSQSRACPKNRQRKTPRRAAQTTDAGAGAGNRRGRDQGGGRGREVEFGNDGNDDDVSGAGGEGCLLVAVLVW